MSTLKISNIQSLSSNAAISIAADGTSTITKLDIPYLSATRTNGYTVASGWSDITWENVIANKYITCSSQNIQFSYAGNYRISVGWRLGSGSDVWTGVRLLDGATTRGIGYGTGQFGPADPGPCEIGFLATIPSNRVNTNMTVQFYREGATMGIATPNANWAPAVVLIIQYMGV
jgi:hypothetical protein